MLHLVQGIVYTQHYMQSGSQSETVFRLVDAVSEEEACKKFEEHYSNMTSEYSVYYRASAEVVSQVIY